MTLKSRKYGKALKKQRKFENQKILEDFTCNLFHQKVSKTIKHQSKSHNLVFGTRKY